MFFSVQFYRELVLDKPSFIMVISDDELEILQDIIKAYF